MASADTLFVVSAQDHQPPAANFAYLDTTNAHLVLDFVDGSTTSAIFTAILPSNYGGGGITVVIWWLAATSNSGNVRWGGGFERDKGGDSITSDNFASNQLATTAAPGTVGQATSTTLTFTNGAQIGSAVAGDPVRFRLQRIGGDAADTLADTAQVYALDFLET